MPDRVQSVPNPAPASGEGVVASSVPSPNEAAEAAAPALSRGELEEDERWRLRVAWMPTPAGQDWLRSYAGTRWYKSNPRAREWVASHPITEVTK